MLKIVQAPHDVLSTPAKPITKIDKSIKELINQMVETLESATDPEGIGLAAPQVGKPLQLFIIKESKEDPLYVFINPKLSIPDGTTMTNERKDEDKKKKKNDVKLEGCLSLQDIWGIVRRYKKVMLTYQDENGDKHTETFDGFFATIIQHEYDHLQGILFPRRVIEQQEKLYKSSYNKKGEMEFEEVSI